MAYYYPQSDPPPPYSSAPTPETVASKVAGMSLQAKAGDTPLLSMFAQGNVVVLESIHSKRTIRIVNVPGETQIAWATGKRDDAKAQFMVHVRGTGVIALQNVSRPECWLTIKDGQADGNGKGGPYCEFNISEIAGKYVVLESVKYPGEFVGFMSKGKPMGSKKIGTGERGRFIPAVHTHAKIKPVETPPPSAPFPVPVPPRPACPARTGDAPLLSLFTEGAVVLLQSRSSGKNLRIINGEVQGLGGQGVHAQFRVHVRRPQVVVLENVASGKYLAIGQGKTTIGGGGKHCDFIVKEVGEGYLCLEAAEHPGQHVGILPDGSVKPPTNTHTGQHAQFKPILHTQSLRAGGTPLLSLFLEGAVVLLQSRSSGKNLRIINGEVEGLGGQGVHAQFRVHVRRPQVVVLENVASGKYLAIGQGKTTIGGGGKHCDFIVKEVGEGYLCLEAAEHPGQHVGILPDGSVKPPTNTHTGQHAQFIPILHTQSLRAGGTPLLSLFTEGALVLLLSRSSGKNLRIINGEVEGLGGQGVLAQFQVHVRRPQVVVLENVASGKYLAIGQGKTTIGGGGKHCDFIVKEVGEGYLCLEAAEHPGQHVGILPDGSVKPPTNTHTGQHAQFIPILHTQSPQYPPPAQPQPQYEPSAQPQPQYEPPALAQPQYPPPVQPQPQYPPPAQPQPQYPPPAQPQPQYPPPAQSQPQYEPPPQAQPQYPPFPQPQPQYPPPAQLQPQYEPPALPQPQYPPFPQPQPQYPPPAQPQPQYPPFPQPQPQYPPFPQPQPQYEPSAQLHPQYQPPAQPQPQYQPPAQSQPQYPPTSQAQPQFIPPDYAVPSPGAYQPPPVAPTPTGPQLPIGYSVMDAFKNGNVVQLIARSNGYPIQIKNATVYGNGSFADPDSQFMITTPGSGAPGVVLLQNIKWIGNYIAIRNGRIHGDGRGGRFCHFCVNILQDNYIYFESVPNPGHYLCMDSNGMAGDPSACGPIHQTTQFFVRIEKQKHPYSTQIATLFNRPSIANTLRDECVIQLYLKSTYLYLAISDNGGAVNTSNPNDKRTFFLLKDRGMGIYSLHSYIYEGFRLRMLKSVLKGKGDPNLNADFRLKESSDGTVCFESVTCPNSFVGISTGGGRRETNLSVFMVNIQNFGESETITKTPLN